MASLPLKFSDSPAVNIATYTVLGLSLTSLALFYFRKSRNPLPAFLPSPRTTVLPYISTVQANALPYPPNLYPGIRDFSTPNGSIRAYEFGPADGNKVIFIHGISSPSTSLRDVAWGLVDRGCRVLLFDLHGRGYSDAPLVAYDERLYCFQIMSVLSSCTPSWTSQPVDFLGYSLGGALAMSYASYYPHHVRRLLLLAPGGLLEKSAIGFAAKVAYMEFWPDWLIALFASKMLKPANLVESKGGECASNRAEMVPSHAIATWQARNHQGFVLAFISTFRRSPLFDQIPGWRQVRKHIETGKLGLKEDADKVCVVFAEDDNVIKPHEMVPRVLDCLGKENVRIHVVGGAEHDLAVTKGSEVVRLFGDFLGLKKINGEKA